MKQLGRPAMALLVATALTGMLTAAPLAAHSASDAYLNLHVVEADASGPWRLSGEWDIALRDLDFVLQLDADGNGRLTWGEVRRRGAAITAYAFRHLHLRAGGGMPCTLAPGALRIAEHADGAYAALRFTATCPRTAAKLALDYRLFFAVDPSHRGIFVFDSRAGTATAVLSPQHTTLNLAL
jgi:hypothetical protein